MSVVIPAYNAARTVAATIESTRAWLDSAGLEHELLVVDDSSTDDTAEKARATGSGVRVLVNERNRGKGYSVRRGMLETRLDWALFMDVDNSTTIDHLDRFAPAAADHDVIIASRRVEGSCIVRPQPRLRQVLGRTFPYLVRILALPELHDTQCGFKVFSRRAVDAVFPPQRLDGFAFDVELLLLARRAGLTIAEVPVAWNNPSDSTLRIHTDTIKMLADVVRCSWRLRRR